MKIAFLASIYATLPYKEHYFAIIDYLSKHGHSVSHLLSVGQTFTGWSQEKKEDLLTNFYKSIRQCDLAIAECSFPSINIGYEISHAIQHEKEIIILKSIDKDLPAVISDTLYSDKNPYIYEYNKNTLFPILKEALQFNAPKKYKKFNVLFTPNMTAKLNLISKKKNLPKSVYIRQLIEKNLAMEELE